MAEPFILLDDARTEGASPARLYRAPVEVVVARRPGEVESALARIAALSAQGFEMAGYLAYEAGLALEPRLAALAERRSGGHGPLVWFGAFKGYETIPAAEVPRWLAARGGRASIGPLVPQISPGGYARAFAALRGFFYATCFVALWWWVVAWARRLDRRMTIELPAWLRVPGVVLAAAGVVLALSCVIAFALVGKGTPAPFDPPREFVAVGPYRWVRNPMYLGAVLVICGAALWLQSAAALAVAVFFILLAHLFVVLYEEPSLEQRFGESYLRYRRAVRRWLPHRPVGVAMLIVLLAGCASQQNAIHYPASRTTNHVDVYHGVKVPDPYRWLEDDNSPETAAWVEAQNTLTFGYLDRIPFRKSLTDRVIALNNYERISAPFRKGPYVFFSKNDGLQNQSVLYVQKGMTGAPEVLLDPNTWSEHGTTRLGAFAPSKDARFAVYGVSTMVITPLGQAS